MSTLPSPLKMFKPGGADVDAGRTMGGPATPGGKEDAVSAGYMELDGATKDADCSKVEVEGGVSSALGCCNEFQPQQGTQQFSCGTCTFVTAGASPEGTAANSAPAAGGNQPPPRPGQTA